MANFRPIWSIQQHPLSKRKREGLGDAQIKALPGLTCWNEKIGCPLAYSCMLRHVHTQPRLPQEKSKKERKGGRKEEESKVSDKPYARVCTLGPDQGYNYLQVKGHGTQQQA